MKEPITGRDLFVISVLCTGFGFLLAWGLFHRWGTFPPSKPIDWPAWVQAVGSVVAICVAIAVPMAQRSHQLAEARAQSHALCKVMAAALRQPVGSFRNRCKMVWQNNEKGLLHEDKVPLEVFSRPPEFDQFRPQLHLLGDLGELVNEVINDQTEAWIQIRALLARTLPMPSDRSERFSAAFKSYEARATRCYEQLRVFVNEH